MPHGRIEAPDVNAAEAIAGREGTRSCGFESTAG